MRSIHIRSIPCPHFPVFGINTDFYTWNPFHNSLKPLTLSQPSHFDIWSIYASHDKMITHKWPKFWNSAFFELNFIQKREHYEWLGITLSIITWSKIKFPTSTSSAFHVETTWKRSFPRRFNLEYTWCVFRVRVTYLFLQYLFMRVAICCMPLGIWKLCQDCNDFFSKNENKMV